jgi:hypothetical protein
MQPVALTVPVAQSQHGAAESIGSVEDDDEFGAVEEIDSAVEVLKLPHHCWRNLSLHCYFPAALLLFDLS